MLRKILLFVLLISLASSFALAQEPASTPEPSSGGDAAPPAETGPSIASGLNNPRHIYFASDGTLYIAEAGTAGDIDAMGPFAEVKAGLTGQISAVSPDGEQTVAIPNLVSFDNGFGQIEGVTSVIATDNSLWATLGMGTQEPIAEGALVESVVEYDRATGEVKQVIDLRAFEQENNPDQAQEVVSNPADLALAEDGTLYIADASGNSVFKWTTDGGLELFAAWPVTDETPQSVPTSVAVGPEGNVYIGFLSGFPFPAGGARIEQYGPDGTLKQTYGGLTLVTDIHFAADGTLYAVEMASGMGDQGFNPNSGRVVSVSADGVVAAVEEGLNFPYGLAEDADGNLYVTVDSVFVAPDSGQVIAVGRGM
jgi:sugar lactone lactonase YvrE